MICAIEIAYYQQAKNSSLPETFIEDLKNPAIENELQRQIQQARSLDVYPYPSLRLAHNHTVFLITVDYLDHRTMLD